jgi:hypothetical protein
MEVGYCRKHGTRISLYILKITTQPGHSIKHHTEAVVLMDNMKLVQFTFGQLLRINHHTNRDGTNRVLVLQVGAQADWCSAASLMPTGWCVPACWRSDGGGEVACKVDLKPMLEQ